MNDCPNGEMRDLLPDLLHDRLTAGERGLVEAHVASCDDCRAELALLAAMRGAMRRAPAVDVGAIAAAIGRTPASAPVGHRATRGWSTNWRAAAAIAAIAVGGASVAIARHDAAPSLPAVAQVPVLAHDSPGVATPVTQPTTLATSASASHPTAARPARTHELAVSGAVSDLSDRELAELLGDLKSLDVLPSADVDASTLVSPAGLDDSGDVL